MLLSAAANAELTSPKPPPRPLMELRDTESDAFRLKMVSTPWFAPISVVTPVRVPWIGVWGAWRPGSLQWTALQAPQLAMENPNDRGASFCWSPRCAFPHAEGLGADALTLPNASRLAIESIGPVAASALALFMRPEMKKDQSVVVRVSPMFALGGYGLELRATWW